MASDPDVILRGVMKLGLAFEDEAEFRRKLKAVADSGNAEVDLVNLAKQISDLEKFEKRALASRKKLAAYATDPTQSVTGGQLEDLRKRNAELQTYLGMLKKAQAATIALGKVDVTPRGADGQPLARKGGAIPRETFARELAPLNQLINEVSAVIGKTKGLVTPTTRTVMTAEAERKQRAVEAKQRVVEQRNQWKADQKQAAKDRQEDRKATAAQAKLDATRTISTQAGPRGRGIDLGIASADPGLRAESREALRRQLDQRKSVERKAAEDIAKFRTKVNEDQINAERAQEFKRLKNMEGVHERAIQMDRDFEAQRDKIAQNAQFKREQINARNPSGRDAFLQAQRGGTLDAESARAAKNYATANQTRLESLRSQYASTPGAGKQAEAAGRAAKTAAADVAKLDARLKELGATSEKTKGSMLGLGNTFQNFLRYALGYGALYKVLEGVTLLSRAVVELDTELRGIQAITNSTDKEMENLAGTIGQVATTSKFSVTEIAKATQVLAQAGIAADDMQSALGATANFAAATGTSLAAAADLISTTRDVFKGINDNTLADQLAKAVNISKLTGEDLKTILSLAGQTAEQFGLSSEQFLAAVATLRNAGLKASTVATGLRQGMLEVFSPDEKLTKALQSRYRALGENMGATAIRARFQEFTNADNPLLSAITELQRLGFNDEGKATFARAFDVRAINALQALIANVDDLAGNESAVTFGQSAAEGATTAMKSLSAAVENLGSNLTLLAADNSKGLVGWLSRVTNGASEAVQRMRELQLAKEAGAEAPASSGTAGARLGGVLSYADRVLESVPLFRAGKAVFTGGDSLRSASSEERASTAATAGSAALSNLKAQQQEFLEAARAFDVEAARLGNSLGTTASGILSMQQASDNLSSTMEAVFGTDSDGALKALKEYSQLAPSLRPQRFKEMQATFTQLQTLDEKTADATLFALERQRKSVADGLDKYREELNREVLQAGEVLQKMREAGKTEATTAEEVRAQALTAQLNTNTELQRIVNGTSQESATVQLAVIRSTSQAIADASKGAATKLGDITKASVDQLQRELTAIVANRPEGERVPAIQEAVNSLLSNFKEIDESTVQYLMSLSGQLQRAAEGVPGGRGDALNVAAGMVGTAADDRERVIENERSQRDNLRRDQINPLLQDRQFQEWVSGKFLEGSQERSTVNRLTTRRNGRDDSFVGVGQGDSFTNSEDFKLAAKLTADYANNQARINKNVEEFTQETERLINAEKALTRAQEERQSAQTNKELDKVPGLIEAERRAEVNLLGLRRNEADRKVAGVSGSDDLDARRGALEQLKRAQSAIDDANEKARKLTEQNDREKAKVSRESEARSLKSDATRAQGDIAGLLGLGDVEGVKQRAEELDAINEKIIDNTRRRLEFEDANNEQLQEEYKRQRELQRAWADELENQLALISSAAEKRERNVRDQALSFAEGRDPNQEAKSNSLGAPLTRGERTRRLIEDQTTATELLRSKQQELLEVQEQIDRVGPNPANEADKKALETARAQKEKLRGDIVGLKEDVAGLGAEINRTAATWASSMEDGFDVEMIKARLESAEYSMENLGQSIQENVVSAFDAVTDSIAEAIIEGESLGDTLKKNLKSVADEYLNLLIKTGINQAGVGLLDILGGGGKKDSAAQTSTGTGAVAEALGGGEKKGGGIFGKVASSLFGGEPGSSADNPLYVVNVGGGLGSIPGLEGEAANTGGIFDSIKKSFSGFSEGFSEGLQGLFDSLTSSVGSIFDFSENQKRSRQAGWVQLAMSFFGPSGGGGGGGGQDVGMTGTGQKFANVAWTGGVIGNAGNVIRAATGGIMKGPGSGTSDSLSGVVLDSKGRRRPIATSTGEGILNKRAVDNLGEDFIHAANQGKFHSASASEASGQSEAVTSASNSVADKIGSAPAAPAVTVDGSVSITNLIDSGSTVASGVRTGRGKRAFLNFIRENRSEIGGYLR